VAFHPTEKNGHQGQLALNPSMGGKFAIFLFDIFLALKHYNIGTYTTYIIFLFNLNDL
jgi:hypothetical protein